MSSERAALRDFWSGYSSKPDITAMMLNAKAADLKEGDCQDILQTMPDVTGLDVVDIGAGIGYRGS